MTAFFIMRSIEHSRLARPCKVSHGKVDMT
jgi:hypothetical protein